MEIKELTFRNYLKALSISDDAKAEEFYKEILGDDWAVMLSYHLKIKKKIGVTDKFNVSFSPTETVFGQFIAIEKALASGYSKDKAIELLAYSVLRPLEDDVFDNTDVEKENVNRENILDYDASEIINTLNIYSTNRDVYIRETYNGVFYAIANSEESVDEDDDREEEQTDEDESGEGLFRKQWYWYAMARSIAEDDLIYPRVENESRLGSVMMTPMTDIAPELAYKRQRDMIEYQRQRKQEIINKSRR